MKQTNWLYRSYPETPGYQPRETSQAAARAVRKDAKRETHERILALLAVRPMTADEIAFDLRLSILYIRPRVTELATDFYVLGELIRAARIEDSGIRRKNLSGKSAAVWQLKVRK